MEQVIHQLDHCTELLQYFTSTGVTFAASDDSLSATNIGTGAAFEVGDHINVAASSQTANNTTWTVVTSAVNKITVENGITDDNAGETIKINQEWWGNWVHVDQFTTLAYAIKCPSDAYLYIDWSNSKGTTTDYTTAVTITGSAAGTAAAVAILAPWARMRIRAKDADQASMNAYLNGKRET